MEKKKLLLIRILVISFLLFQNTIVFSSECKKLSQIKNQFESYEHEYGNCLHPSSVSCPPDQNMEPINQSVNLWWQKYIDSNVSCENEEFFFTGTGFYIDKESCSQVEWGEANSSDDVTHLLDEVSSKAVKGLMECFHPDNGSYPNEDIYRAIVIHMNEKISGNGIKIYCHKDKCYQKIYNKKEDPDKNTPLAYTTRGGVGDFIAFTNPRGFKGRPKRSLISTFAHEILHNVGRKSSYYTELDTHDHGGHEYASLGHHAADRVYSCQDLCFGGYLSNLETCETCMTYPSSDLYSRSTVHPNCIGFIESEQLREDVLNFYSSELSKVSSCSVGGDFFMEESSSDNAQIQEECINNLYSEMQSQLRSYQRQGKTVNIPWINKHLENLNRYVTINKFKNKTYALCLERKKAYEANESLTAINGKLNAISSGMQTLVSDNNSCNHLSASGERWVLTKRASSVEEACQRSLQAKAISVGWFELGLDGDVNNCD